jgi:hypothetical protein
MQTNLVKIILDNADKMLYHPNIIVYIKLFLVILMLYTLTI